MEMSHDILGPGQARSSLTTDKQTEIQLKNYQNRNQHQILHKYTKIEQNRTIKSRDTTTSGFLQ